MKKIIFFLLFFPIFVWASMSSENFQVDSDVIGSFGDWGSSSNYNLGDTGGEFGIGDFESLAYKLHAGFWRNSNYSISIACPDSLIMGSIAGTGQSDLAGNSIACTIITNNPSGYSLLWRASAQEMIGTTNPNNKILAYSPETVDVPEYWTVDSLSSEWGGHIGKDSTTIDTNKWGSEDTYAQGKWLNVGMSDYEIVRRLNSTSEVGDIEKIFFGAEVGSSKIQPSGTYEVDVILTAITL